MVEAACSAGGNVRFTVYENADHDAWTPTYCARRLTNGCFSTHTARSVKEMEAVVNKMFNEIALYGNLTVSINDGGGRGSCCSIILQLNSE
jgi:hypothetical protein